MKKTKKIVALIISLLMLVLCITGCTTDTATNSGENCVHVYGEWTETKKATCEGNGEQQRVCSLCGDTETNPTTTEHHQFSLWTVTEASHHRVCETCGKTFDSGVHNYVDGVCKDCNCTEIANRKVLLVSIDGLRPDAIMNHSFIKELMATSSYCLNAKTINPSVTLPAHTSMFYGVEASTHGVTNNSSIKSPRLGNGITETLAKANKSSAMFYDWKNLQNLTNEDSVKQTYINGSNKEPGKEKYEASADALTDAVIQHIQTSPTDFTFLYYGLTDEMGHTYDWMSDKYYWGIERVFNNLQRVLDSLPEEYVVIITSDHGGGGANGADDHGSKHPMDMIIPFFMMGENIDAGILKDVSILDVAPTVVDFLGVKPEKYWVGESLMNSSLSDFDENAQQQAFDILASEDSYVDVHRGYVESVVLSDGTVTVCGSVKPKYNNQNNKFSAFGLSKDTVQEWLDLGYRYFTFKVELSANPGETLPTHIYIYEWEEKREFLIGADEYIANNSFVTIDLELLKYALLDDHPYLIFAFTKDGDWIPTGNDGYLTFSNVSFSYTLPA